MPKIRITHNEPKSKLSLEVSVRARDKDGRYEDSERHVLRPGAQMHTNVRANQDVVITPASTHRADEIEAEPATIVHAEKTDE